MVGVDHSGEFIDPGPQRGGGRRASTRGSVSPTCATSTSTTTFDAVICLCQGGFGLLGGTEDAALITRFAAALRPGGRLALSAFHVAFAVRFLEPTTSSTPRPA